MTFFANNCYIGTAIFAVMQDERVLIVSNMARIHKEIIDGNDNEVQFDRVPGARH